MSDDQSQRRDVLRAGALLGLLGCAGRAQMPAASAGAMTDSPAPRRRRELYGLLGDLPDRNRPISATRTNEEVREKYVLESWVLDLNGIEPTPAYVARPLDGGTRTPGIVFNHSHGGGYDIGKKEFVEGRSYLQPTPYAETLTALGYTAVCIDNWCFGERNHATEADTFKDMLWKGRVLWGMMMYDSLRALDWLAARPDVDPARLGTLGMSMGSTAAWWLGALDERIKVTVDICCLTDFDALIARKNLRLHGIFYYVPGLLKHFTAARINELIVPRAHLGIAGRLDPLTPSDGLDRIEAELKRAYAAAGHPERWRLLRYDVAHQETAEAREEIVKFLRAHL